MEEKQAKGKALDLVNKSKIAYIGSVDEGIPNVKAMLVAKVEGLNTVWFSTNTQSRRVEQFIKDENACVYFCDQEDFVGVMMVGTMAVCQDEASKKMIWEDGDEQYYPQGVTDPDYTVLKFTTSRVNIYHGLENMDLSL